MQDIMKKTIDAIRGECGLAGGALVMIDNGRVSYECFGLADVENGRNITTDTYFDIASCSKAFTAMLGAQAVEKGLLDWDTPVVKYMPAFKTIDPYVTAHVTGRDMLSHRTGMPRHDFMRAKFLWDRADMVRRVAYMGLTAGFREKFQYCNQMYIAFGHVLEQITGKTWEELLDEWIMKPLGIPARVRGSDDGMRGLDYALPYKTDGYAISRDEYCVGSAPAPCGGIKLNIKGMARWVEALLGRGALDGTRIVGEKAFDDLWRPLIPAGDMESPFELMPCYALGWTVSAYRGRRLISHGGAINGFNSRVSLLPDENKGCAVLINTLPTSAPQALCAVMLDTMLGVDERDYSAFLKPIRQLRERLDGHKAAQNALEPLSEEVIDALRGTYTHPTYDEFTLTADGRFLCFAYADIEVRLGRGADGVVRGYPKDGMGLIEITPAEGGVLMRNHDSALRIFFERVQA